MTQKELFAILDAINPRIHDVKAYLDRMCGQSPLSIVFLKEGKFFSSSELTDENAPYAWGIALPAHNLVLRLQAITPQIYQDAVQAAPKNAPDKEICKIAKDSIASLDTMKNLLTWIARDQDIDVLHRNMEALLTTLDILKYKKVCIPNENWNNPSWLGTDYYLYDEYCKTCLSHAILHDKTEVLLFSLNPLNLR